MNFNSLQPGLDARLNGARAHARAKIEEAKVVAEDVRDQGREEASQCPDERSAKEVFKDYFVEADRHVQEAHQQAALGLLSELVAIRLQAGVNPAELARELEGGVPAWVHDEVGAVVEFSSSLQRVLRVAVAYLCQNCWKQAEQNGPVPAPAQKPRRGRGIPPDVADNERVAAACVRFGDVWPSHLVEICEDLEHSGAKFPKVFKKHEELESWAEVAEELRNSQNKSVKKRFGQYLRYRLNKVPKKLPDSFPSIF